MKYTNEDISKRLGLELLEPDMAEQMLASFYETLDTKMSLTLADKLTDEQLARFNDLKDNDNEAADQLLQEIVPNYEALLDEEADKLLQEIDDNAADMLT